MDLAEFWTARLDEEEREANREAESLARFEKRPGDWTRFMCDPVLGPFGGQSPTRDIATGLYVGKLTDPHRVLREVAVLRVLLGDHHPTRSYGDFGLTYPAAARYCADCGPGDNWQIEAEPEDWEFARWPCTRARQGVSIWSDHPDFDPAWALPVAADH